MMPNTINFPLDNYSSRNGAPVYWLAVHTAEGARTVESLGWFFRSIPNASSHAGIDDTKVAFYVNTRYSAWTLRNGNPYSDNLELCGFAEWSPAEWQDHPVMLENCAWWLAMRAKERDIPLKKLSPREVGQRKAGVIGHADYTYGTGDGTHTDPGVNFPWEQVIWRAREITGNGHVTPDKKVGNPDMAIIQLTPTAPPENWEDSATWPWREETINLGYVRGWNGRCIVRASFGHPGGRIYRAHFDYPHLQHNLDWELWPGSWCAPAYKQEKEYVFEPDVEGHCSLMFSYAAPGGASIAVEFEG